MVIWTGIISFDIYPSYPIVKAESIVNPDHLDQSPNFDIFSRFQPLQSDYIEVQVRLF